LSLNIIIPPEHQSAPSGRYDGGLARAAAELKDKHAAGRIDWDAADWAGLNEAQVRIARRRRMKNQDFDLEFDAPGHHDPAMATLRRLETDPSAWVDENLDLYERNCEKAKTQQLPGQERWEKEHEEERLQNVLYASAFMRKLRDAGIDARDEEHPNARIWLNEWTRNGLVGVNAWMKPQEMDEEGYLFELSQASTQRQKDLLTYNFLACHNRRKVQRTLTSLQDPGPEYSVMRFNERGIATKEKYRGWRTVLLVLIVSEVITEAEAEKAFGPAMGEAAAWYREQLKVWRQIRIGKAI
jgi:hypothetical protein